MNSGLAKRHVLKGNADGRAPKVCVLAYQIPPHFGGGGICAVRYASYLARHQEPVDLLTCTRNPDPVEGVEIVRFSLPSWYALKGGGGKLASLRRQLYAIVVVSRLRRYFVENKIDVVHCVAAKWFSLVAVQAARRAGIASIVEATLLDGDDADTVGRKSHGWIMLPLYKKADSVVCVSPSLEEACVRGGIEPERCQVIVNPVDTGLFSPVSVDEKKTLRTKLEIDQFEHVILTVGVVRPRKNAAEMVEMFASIATEYPASCLVIVGPHDKDEESRTYAARLRELISVFGLNDRVILTGSVNNVHEWMQAADVFVFASIREGLGNVLLEALSTGLPVVSTPIHGIAAFVLDENSNGFVVPEMRHGGPQVKQLLSDSALRAAFGAKGREAALSRYSEDVVMGEYMELYRRLSRR